MPHPVLTNGGTSKEWELENPILSAGKTGTETDTGKYKIGNGSSFWNSLKYFNDFENHYWKNSVDDNHNSKDLTPAQAGKGLFQWQDNGAVVYCDEKSFLPLNSQTRIVQLALNDDTALTTSAKAYFRVPSAINTWVLTSVAAMCKIASTSGNPTFTIKKGATNMLSTALTIDVNETDSATALTPAVIAAGQRTVSTADQIEVACSVSGNGCTWAVVELNFQLS